VHALARLLLEVIVTRMETRVCRLCGEEKPLATEFYRDKTNKTGYRNNCRQCQIDKAAEWAKANPEKFKAGQKRHYNKYSERYKAKFRRRSAENPGRNYRLWGKAYNERHSAERLAHVVRWQRDNPDKLKAQIKARVLKDKPDRCQGCPLETSRLEKHHDDYSRPLDVRWLCKRCHVKADNARRERERLSSVC
jgi:hypothetical protein